MCGSKVLKLFIILSFFLINRASSLPVTLENDNEFFDERNNKQLNDNVNLISEQNENTSEEDSAEMDYIPQGRKQKLFEEYLSQMLEKYYDEVIAPNLTDSKVFSHNYETKNGTWDYGKYFDQQELLLNENHEKMLADNPSNSGTGDIDNAAANITDDTQTNNLKSKSNIPPEREHSKRYWLSHLQKFILESTGRGNNSTFVPSAISDPVKEILNRTNSIQMQSYVPDMQVEDEYLDKKIRSFYPSCEVPRNTDEEAWKDANTMNLFFNVNYNSEAVTIGEQQGQEDTVNIASATLRLHRLPQESNFTIAENCKSGGPNSISDDDKQIRVSVYWYGRSLKKHKATKRKLADSRMVPMFEPRSSSGSSSMHYVEFNVRPAAKTWVRGRNAGLGVVVEDMDGGQLNAARFFKGVACDTVGNVSTPIPIPTAFLDAHRSALGFGVSNSSQSNAGAYNSLLPNLDICTVQMYAGVAGSTRTPIDNTKIICKMLRSGSSAISTASSGFSTAPEDSPRRPPSVVDTGRHIRHQHQPHRAEATDIWDKIVDKRLVVKNSQLHEFNLQLQNITNVNS